MECSTGATSLASAVQWGGGGVPEPEFERDAVGLGFTSAAATANDVGIAPSGIAVREPQREPVGRFRSARRRACRWAGTSSNPDRRRAVRRDGRRRPCLRIIGSRLTLDLALEALRSQSKTRTLARPEIVTVENNKAIMSLGEEIPYATVSSAGTQIQFKEAVLRLEVTPTVIREGDQNKIKMAVIVENNSRGDVVNFGASLGSPPAINKKRAETQVLIKEGERLVIGGVTNSTFIETERKIPLSATSDLRWLFKANRTRQDHELVVFNQPSLCARRGPLVTRPRASALAAGRRWGGVFRFLTAGESQR